MEETTSKMRRRKRPTVVCSRCRAKKSRCDKLLPCSNCVKAKCPEMCTYENGVGPNHTVSPSASSSSPVAISWSDSMEKHLQSQNIVNRLENLPGTNAMPAPKPKIPRLIFDTNDFLIGINPVLRTSDMINVHMDLASTFAESPPKFHSGQMFRCLRTNTRVISLVDVSQQEPGARLFWKFSDRANNLKLMTIQSLPEDRTRDALAAVRFRFGPQFIDIEPHNLANVANTPAAKVCSDYGVTLGLSFSNVLYLEGSYAEILRNLLPPRHAVIAYVERFFQKIYPVYPVVDEDWLTDNIGRLLVYQDNRLVEVRIACADDLFVLAMLLFIMRLAYLLYFTNSNEENAAMLHQVQPWGLRLFDAQITISAVETGMRLLQTGLFRRKVLFLSLQAHLLGAVVHLHSLENELALNIMDHTCNVGQLLQMATSLTMDRDPDYICDTMPSDFKSQNLRRKVWYVLVRLDYTMSYVFSCPRVIAKDQYNTKLPWYSPAGCNISDHGLEGEVIKVMRDIHSILSEGSDLLDIALDVRTAHRAVDIVAKITDLEILVDERFGPMKQYFHASSNRIHLCSSLVMLQLQTHVLLKMFIAYLYYFLHLFYSYKNEHEMDFFFFRKVILIVFSEMNYFCSELMFTRDLVFDSTFSLLMSPTILTYLHMVAMVGLGFAIRLHCTAFILERNGDAAGLKMLRSLTSRNETFVLRKLKLCKLLSERYFYAWKCSKANGYGYRMVYHNHMYSSNIESLTRAKIWWSERQQSEMFNLIPENVPIQMSDVGDVLLHCYYSNRSLDDADLQGPDLHKTIQTDNFWIVFNGLNQRDPYAVPSVPKPEPALTSVLVNGPTVVTGDFPQPQLATDIPTGHEMFDFNLFSTDWSIDEFLNG